MRKPISLFLCISRSRKSTSPAKRRRWIASQDWSSALLQGCWVRRLRSHLLAARTCLCSSNRLAMQSAVPQTFLTYRKISLGPVPFLEQRRCSRFYLRSLSDSAMKYGIAPKRSSAVEYQSDVDPA